MPLDEGRKEVVTCSSDHLLEPSQTGKNPALCRMIDKNVISKSEHSFVLNKNELPKCSFLKNFYFLEGKMLTCPR